MTDAYGLATGVRQSAALVNTLRRAVAYAQQRSHRYVTLEHLLLALSDDPDAIALLQSVRADIAMLRNQAADVVNRRLSTLYAPGNMELRPSYKLERVLQTASDEAAKSPYGELDGAFVTAALVTEADSLAAKLLMQHRLGFGQAMSWLHANRNRPAPPSTQASPRPAAPPQASFGDAQPEGMLARARSMQDAEERRQRAEPHFSPGEPPRQPAPQVNGRHAWRMEPRFNGGAAPPPPNHHTPGFGASLRDVLPQSVPPPPPQRERTLRKALEQVHVPEEQLEESGAASPPKAQRNESRALVPYGAADPASQAAASRLGETIPRKMRAGKPRPVEIRISREESEMLFHGLEGRGMPQAHNSSVARAMTVMLRAPEDGFTVEPLAPETQWMFDRPQFLETEEFGRWGWMVTPKEKGRQRLRLIVSAKDVDGKGMVGDATLPDKIIEVRVRTNYGRAIGKMIGWAFLMATGGALTELALRFLPHVLPNLF